MSVQSEIDRIITAVGNAYSKVSEKGGTVPASQTVANLATAIDSIPAGSATSLQSKSVTYTDNGTATITPDEGYDGLSSVDVTVNVSGGGYIENLIIQDQNEDVSLSVHDVRFNSCTFLNCSRIIFFGESTNVSFTMCSFINLTILCTQSIHDAIVNESAGNFVNEVTFDLMN